MDDGRGPVKPRRYDATRRRARSAVTRQQIIEAAGACFARDGYQATTIAAIARAAKVNPDTVHHLVGRKPTVLRELIEQALSGTDHAVTAEQRPPIAAMIAEPDPVEKLRIYAASIRETHERMAPLLIAMRDAATNDPEAGQVWHEITERRAANMRKLAADLHATGRMRLDLSIEDAADIVWATNSSELWMLLTHQRGWTPDHFQHWLADTWCRLLLR